MALKERYFIEAYPERVDSDTVWYDRSVVPLSWLNETLKIRKYKWTVSVIDSEYTFIDSTE